MVSGSKNLLELTITSLSEPSCAQLPFKENGHLLAPASSSMPSGSQGRANAPGSTLQGFDNTTLPSAATGCPLQQRKAAHRDWPRTVTRRPVPPTARGTKHPLQRRDAVHREWLCAAGSSTDPLQLSEGLGAALRKSLQWCHCNDFQGRGGQLGVGLPLLANKYILAEKGQSAFWGEGNFAPH